MSPEQIHEELLALARSAGFDVRGVDRNSDLPVASGVCRVRGSIWVILAATESLEERSEVLVEALRAHASSMLSDRYLPPAVRARLGV
ncbi:MAG: hypothetical protein AAEJ52_15970 [Myxococcota bacterium]|jgi:hypothetical protein